jgi:gliding motility-associated-like protein
VSRDSVFLRVVPEMNLDFSSERQADCIGESVLSVKNLTDSLMAEDKLYFDFGDGFTSDMDEIDHVFAQSGEFNVKLVGVREFCVTEKILPMVFGPIKLPNVITPGNEDDKNDTFTIQYGDKPGPTPDDYGFTTSIIIYDRWGRKVYDNPDYKSDWAGGDLSAGVYYYEVSVKDHATCKGWVQLVK